MYNHIHHGRLHAFLLTILTLVTCLLVANNSNAQWTSQGPGPAQNSQTEGIPLNSNPISGAVNTVTPHPSDATILYIGAVNGGIWKTTNATAATPTWVNQTEINSDLSIGALEFDLSDATNNTLVAGFGNTSSFNSNGKINNGILRTTNGGGTWTVINGNGTFVGNSITGIAAQGATIVCSATNGVWRTIDTGDNWTLISGSGTGLPAGIAYDLIQDPDDPTRLITNAGTNGFYDSDDMGATWNSISDATVTAAMGSVGNIEFAYGNSNNIYAAVVAAAPNDILSAVLRSGDDGATWTNLDLPLTTETVPPDGLSAGATNIHGIHPGRQGTLHLSIEADPSNANICYVGGDRQPDSYEPTPQGNTRWPNSIGANNYTGRLFRINASLAAGSQASAITHNNTTGGSAPHGDSRDMSFDAAGGLIEGDDGGVYKRNTPNLNSGDWTSLNGDLVIIEAHNAAWDARSNLILLGAQDNGVKMQQTSGNTTWTTFVNADGGDVAVDDQSTPGNSIRFFSIQRLGGFRRRVYTSANVFVSSTLLGQNIIGSPLTLGTLPGNSPFITPYVLNNSNPNNMMIGMQAGFYESLDQGDNWTLMEANVINSNLGQSPIGYGAADNVNICYVGIGNNIRIRTAAAPAAFANSAAYAGGNVIDIAVDPTTAAQAFAIDNNQVFQTTTTGAAWNDITGNLLSINPGNLTCVAYSTSGNNAVIVGADNGAYVAFGPNFNEWVTIGTGLPKAKVSDIEYDVADQMLLVSTFGRGTYTISLSERDPIDIGLVLDLSGSMGRAACPGCDSKLEVLKDAVEIFINLWHEFAITQDRMSVSYFESNIADLDIGGTNLISVVDQKDAIIADIRSQTTGNNTAMGGGLQSAINILQDDPTRIRSIVLFTDGMQNVNPMVDEVSYNIEDDASISRTSNVVATSPVTTLNPALDIHVNTIGVGATDPFVDLLDDIADNTGGVSKITMTPDEELRKFYVLELIDALRESSPQLVDYRYNEISQQTVSSVNQHTENVTLTKGAKKVVFKLSWKRGNPVSFGAIKRNGQNVSKLGKYTSGEFFQIYSIELPMKIGNQTITSAGDWSIGISGNEGNKYELAIIVDEHEFDYDVTLGTKDYQVGDPIDLSVDLAYSGTPIANASKVIATVHRPKTSIGTLLSKTKVKPNEETLLIEPGISIGQQKLDALFQQSSFQDQIKPIEEVIVLTNNGTGNYSGQITNTTVVGNYTVTFEIEGEHPNLGTYKREETVSTMVEFGASALTVNDIELTSFGKEGDNDIWKAYLSPIDKYGNYLGPDYGYSIKATLSNGTVLTTIDNGDGSYIIPLTTKQGTDPVLTIFIDEEVVFADPISTLNKDRRFALGARIGGTLPLGAFNTTYDPSLMVEVDLEYRLGRLFALEAVGGVYGFKTNYVIGGATLYAKKYFQVKKSQPYVAVGAGYFFPKNAQGRVGISGAVGFQRQIRDRVRGSLGVSYFHLLPNTVNRQFLGIHLGFKYMF